MSESFVEPADAVGEALARRRILSAPQQVSAAVEDLILDGTLRPGDRLPSVEEVARRLTVSVPTASQALQALRAEAVLTVARGRNGGYRVAAEAIDAIGRVRSGAVLGRPAQPRAEGYAELLQVREVQDVLAARVAASRRTDADLRELEGLLPRSPSAMPVDLEAAFDLDLRFHRLVALSTHNSRIVAFTTQTTLALRRYPHASDLRPADVLHGLDKVLTAIRVGDTAGAAAAMRRHLRRSDEFFGAQV